MSKDKNNNLSVSKTATEQLADKKQKITRLKILFIADSEHHCLTQVKHKQTSGPTEFRFGRNFSSDSGRNSGSVPVRPNL